jgi:hypothetical protein
VNCLGPLLLGTGLALGFFALALGWVYWYRRRREELQAGGYYDEDEG